MRIILLHLLNLMDSLCCFFVFGVFVVWFGFGFFVLKMLSAICICSLCTVHKDFMVSVFMSGKRQEGCPSFLSHCILLL